MEDEAFDKFNAPQFVDFSKKMHYFDDTVDTFFDVDHENEPEAEKKTANEISVEEPFFSPVIQLDNSSENNDNNYPDDSHQAKAGYRLRKSMSIGNLIMFSEQEDYNPSVNDICENVNELHLNHQQDEKREKEPKLFKGKSGFAFSRKAGSQELHRKMSQEHLNKLAEPKRYTSVENLKHGFPVKYISMAEAISQFQNRTPIRFRSKPNLTQVPFVPLTRTVPESPTLKTKTRSRPQQILTFEEREQKEYEEEQKFKVRALPINKRILRSPPKLPACTEKKTVTKPKPFHLTAPRPKTAIATPKKFVFHARPVPTSEKLHKVQEVQKRECVKPITPTFMKNYKPPSHRVEEPSNLVKIPPKDRPRFTMMKPFSFDYRDQLVHKKKEQMIRKLEEEERRAREFHAKPVPKYIHKKSESMKSESESSVASSKKHYSTENLSLHFKARPPTSIHKKPFVPAKSNKPLTQIEPFQLSSEQRLQERQEFERERLLKEEKLMILKQAEEEERLRLEQEEVIKLRKAAEYKAQPIKKYKELIIQPSGKVTVPCTPKFIKRNKENVADNSM